MTATHNVSKVKLYSCATSLSHTTIWRRHSGRFGLAGATATAGVKRSSSCSATASDERTSDEETLDAMTGRSSWRALRIRRVSRSEHYHLTPSTGSENDGEGDGDEGATKRRLAASRAACFGT